MGHLDGMWSGGADVPQQRGAVSEQWRTPVAFNGCALVPGDGANPGANLTNFTAIVGVALSDQTRDGRGNLGVLRGMHLPISAACARQASAGHAIGPGNPGWERLDTAAPNGVGVQYLPDGVEAESLDGAARGLDGKLWPAPTLIKMGLGDAVVVHHACPHSSSWNLWSEPRVMVYFRLTRVGRPEGKAATYPEALCEPFLEFDGVRGALSNAVARL